MGRAAAPRWVAPPPPRRRSPRAPPPRRYMDERVVWSHFIQMCEGLLCLHDQKIVHRDIKAANVFLAADGSVKIGDLNVSKRMKGHLLRTQIGTPYYMSPEVWLNKPYSFGADVWAVGCQ